MEIVKSSLLRFCDPAKIFYGFFLSLQVEFNVSGESKVNRLFLRLVFFSLGGVLVRQNGEGFFLLKGL